jgi:hypothetical protein
MEKKTHLILKCTTLSPDKRIFTKLQGYNEKFNFPTVFDQEQSMDEETI